MKFDILKFLRWIIALPFSIIIALFVVVITSDFMYTFHTGVHDDIVAAIMGALLSAIGGFTAAISTIIIVPKPKKFGAIGCIIIATVVIGVQLYFKLTDSLPVEVQNDNYFPAPLLGIYLGAGLAYYLGYKKFRYNYWAVKIPD
ncbi:hypothetical protein IM792_09145 [Mucilaginibacter sp. JRF]|uniref:hypothetical protein n=1 Tax=Mucilaginibacter sp. JRF TaxID=2780088 RepID=UPI00187EAC15|nr:hypothetical protein [Mucilaginibacter sp. JRF]MBE9584609.1 hypothetical protein [Mucilaginibacter sp. JRF]